MNKMIGLPEPSDTDDHAVTGCSLTAAVAVEWSFVGCAIIAIK